MGLLYEVSGLRRSRSWRGETGTYKAAIVLYSCRVVCRYKGKMASQIVTFVIKNDISGQRKTVAVSDRLPANENSATEDAT